MFHDVLPRTDASGGGAERFAVPVPVFDAILSTIAGRGYRGCSVADAQAAPGERRVAITFDDGTRSHYDHALPLLVEHGMTATFYVITERVGSPGYATWDELREMRASGMSIQSHTRSHPFLSELDAGEVRAQLLQSKAKLDEELGQDTVELGLPGGDAPARALRRLIPECGYRTVASSRWGVNGDVAPGGGAPSWIRRCTVRGALSRDDAARIIEGDRLLAAARYPREASLAAIRSSLGPTRYARIRGRVLDALRGSSAP